MTSPSPAGQRDAHWTASAFDFTWISQYPPITSLASAKGPSVTLGFPRENETRVPIEGGWSPSSASSTPAFVSASLYFVIAATISALGTAPGSAFSYPWGIISIMNRIVVPPSTRATIGGPRDRHGGRFSAARPQVRGTQLPDMVPTTTSKDLAFACAAALSIHFSTFCRVLANRRMASSWVMRSVLS